MQAITTLASVSLSGCENEEQLGKISGDEALPIPRKDSETVFKHKCKGKILLTFFLIT